MEPTKTTFLSWTTDPAKKGWLAFGDRGEAEQHQSAMPEEHRGGITTGDAPAGTTLINGELRQPGALRNIRIAFGADARLPYHGELENQRADALRALGAHLADKP